MNELALFAGAGGGILGGKLLGWRTVCAVERNAFAAQVLAQRQNDGILEPFPIWSDVQSFDGKPWKGIVDVISGGFPCQDISVAGKGAGIDGDQSGVWKHMARIIDEIRPRFVFVENSPLLVSRGLVRVLGDLATMGFNARWGIVGAHHVGAPHKRDRCWIVAHSNGKHDDFSGFCSGEISQFETSQVSRYFSDSDCERLALRESKQKDNGTQQQALIGTNWWATEPRVGRVANGLAYRVDRLKAIGNGQVPSVAANAFEILLDRY